MTTFELEQTDVRGDGRIILYKRPGLKKPKWQARISVPNSVGYKVISTKTADFKEAERFALNLYEELYMQVKAGGALNTKTFKQVYAEWKEQAETSHTRSQGSWDSTIERIESYALPYFGLMRIDEIREREFADYWVWRGLNYNRRPPTPSTLQRERTGIMPVFKYALAKGYITKLPEAKAPTAKGQRRPTFSQKEWSTINKAMGGWLREGILLATQRDRQMAVSCFTLLVHSGLRIGELRRLRWRDISSVNDPENGKYFVASARGKTGARQVVFQPEASPTFQLLYLHRCAELIDEDCEGEQPKPEPDEPILCHPDGSEIVEYRKAFRSLLEFAGVPLDLDGKPRSVYSLRHFYATRRLSENTNPYLLASNMGTSIEMLERHYGHVINSTVAKEITGKKPMSIVVKGDIEFPF